MRCICIIFFGFCQCLFAQVKNVPLSVDDSAQVKKTITIKEVEVKSRSGNANVMSPSAGLSFNIKELKALPRLVGEADPYKALQYMGGVSQASEANSGLYVRGGNNDQNLVMLNDIQIQNPTHALGLFSIFNPDLISRMNFFKSGIPAEYGGRLSSVVDISTSNDIPDKLKVDGTVGLITSRLSVSVPISGSFSAYGSYRQSYISTTVMPVLQLFGVSKMLTRNKYEFKDVNGGFVLKTGKKGRLSGHYYWGNDNIVINNSAGELNVDDNATYWGNAAGSLQYNYIFSANSSMNHKLIYTDYHVQSAVNLLNSNNSLMSKMQNLSYKGSFFHTRQNHEMKYGIELDHYTTLPRMLNSDSLVPMDIGNKKNNYHSTLAAVYGRDEWSSGRWLLHYGIRLSLYTLWGPYTDYVQGGQNTYYASDFAVKTYANPEPRFFVRYVLADNSSVKVSASRLAQYFNQIPILSIGIPTDIQMPATTYVKPSACWHFSGGYFYNTPGNKWELSCEGYYKSFSNLHEFNNNIFDTFTNNFSDRDLLTGKGWAYGSELTLRRNGSKFSGWLSYNLAWNIRQFDAINNGKPFLDRNDRRHDLSLVLLYDINKKWSISSLFVYASGTRLNLPVSWYVIDNKVVWEYGRYNAFVMPDYHRLDVSASYKMKQWKGVRSELNFSVYNLYNRANPYGVYFKSTTDNMQQFNFQLKMSYLLPIIPSVSWVFHW